MTSKESVDIIGYWLHHTAAMHRRAFGKQTKEFGLTPEQYGTLLQLNTLEGVSQKRLAGMMYKDQATTGKMIEKLEGKGLVHRKPDPSDRRAFLLHLTEEGRQTLAQMLPLDMAFHEETAQGISPEELKLFFRIMNTMNENLQKKLENEG